MVRTPLPSSRVEILDPLRGLAALSVCWFHFTAANSVAHGWLRETGEYGWLGVDVFFVLSGFVIPFSMHTGGYYLGRDFWRFLAKRLIRLEPPYLTSILVVLALGYAGSLVPGFRGSPPAVTPVQLALHLGYLVGLTGHSWLNPVYWTLGIELQYYLVMALAYPAVASRRPLVRAVAVAGLVATSVLITPRMFVFHHLGVFAVGVLAFHYRRGLLPRSEHVVGTLAVGCVCWATVGLAAALAGTATGLLVAYGRWPKSRWLWPLSALGTVSYSLYLLHTPVGGRVCNLGGRFASTTASEIVVLFAAVIASVLSAVAFYLLIERPAQRLSSRIRYKRDSV